MELKSKKIISVLTVLCMVLSLTACGKEQTVSYQMESTESGFEMKDTMTLQAKGDKVQRMTEVIEINLAELDEESQSLAVSVYESEIVEAYKAVEGVSCSGELAEGVYTITIDFELKGDTVEQLAEQGLLEIEGSTKGISLKRTGDLLEATGYTVVE